MGNANTRRRGVAIVGMSCMFPGADTLEKFWENIVGKVDCIGSAPPDWQPEYFYDPSGRDSDRSYTMTGGFLGELCRFDPLKYGIVPSSIEGSEPDHFIALRCAYEAMADAGFPEIPINREKTGVIVGRGLFVNRGWATVFQRTVTVDQVIGVLRALEPGRSEADLRFLRTELLRSLPPVNSDTFPGLVHSALVGRIANRLDLMGPAYTVDAACAASLLAVDHAIRELHSGTCDAVIVGGSQVSIPAPVHILFCHLGALSHQGKIAPFSAAANGTLLGQGCGMLVLKRLEDAERDGNRIYAVIKSVGTSSDGKGVGLLAPRTEGQQLAIRRAYEYSEIPVSSVSLIEAHGTGIAMGDATEIKSLKACFMPTVKSGQSIAIGSVKSMLGHLIPASGAASLIKTALSLYHRVLPPTLHAEEVHPGLELDKSPFYVCNETRPWLNPRRDTPRRAGINAFGFGGANAHALLEAYETEDERTFERLEKKWPVELVVLSAGDRHALQNRIKALLDWLAKAEAPRLLDVAASCSRERGKNRLAVVAKNIADLTHKLSHALKLLNDESRQQIQDRNGIYWYANPLTEQGRIAFVFPGEGSQYPNMLGNLCRHFPEVRRQFDLTAAGYAQTHDKEPWALGRILYPQPNQQANAESALFEMETAVAVVTAAARGLLSLLTKFGIEADAVVGHSSGEFAACLASGVFTPKDEQEMLEYITKGMVSTAQVAASTGLPRVMLLAVGGAEPGAVEKIVTEAQGQIVVAMDNCPHQKILLGDENVIKRAWDELRGKGGFCEQLQWDRPYHSDAFLPACQAIQEYIGSLDLQPPRIDFWSCATAKKFPMEIDAVSALMVRQWHSPVRFRETVDAMYLDGIRIFVEVGPRSNLSSFVTDTLGERPHASVPLNIHTKHDLDQLCRALGMLAAHGVSVKLDELYAARKPTKFDFADLPPAGPKPEPILRLELPLLEVSDATAKLFASKPKTAAQQSADIADPAEPVRQQQSTRPVALTDALQPVTAVGVSSSTDGLELKHGVEIERDVADSAARRAALTEFQKTMREFLDLQQQVMAFRYAPKTSSTSVDKTVGSNSDYFSSGRIVEKSEYSNVVLVENRGHHQSGVIGSDQSDQIVSEVEPLVVTKELFSEKELPNVFLDAILEFDASQRIVAECELDIGKHKFLLDHTFFGRGLSRFEPEITPLPITPLAVTLELMAETAHQLYPNCRVHALANVGISRWLPMLVKTRRIRMIAETYEFGIVQVAAYEADREGMHAEIARATVEFVSVGTELGSQRLQDPGKKPPPWSKEELYGKVLYHGPAFRGIEDVTYWSPKCVAVTLHPPAPLVPGRQLSVPVQLIDIASQIPALIHGNYWEFESPICKLAFPNFFDRLEIVAPFPENQPLLAIATIEEDSTVLRSNTEIRTMDGRVILRYWGKTEEVVLFPRCVYEYTFKPKKRGCADDITNLFAGVPGINWCAMTKTQDTGFKVFVHNLWSQVAARLFLDGPEREIFSSLATTPVGVAGWLSGRIAAKDAVRACLRLNCAMADVRIESNQNGQPSAIAEGGAASLVSLSHKEFSAVAVAACRQHVIGVGIDLEPAKDLDDIVSEDGFDSEERAVIQGSAEISDIRSELWLRAAWCAKEAIGKALGLGLLGGPRNIRMVSLDAERGCFAATPVGALADAARQLGFGENEKIEAWCRFYEDKVIGLCILLPQSGR